MTAEEMQRSIEAHDRQLDAILGRLVSLQHLDGIEDRLGARIVDIEERLGARFVDLEERLGARIVDLEGRLVSLIAGEVGSLHSEIRELDQRIDARLASIDSRLKLQAGLIQSGARAMARFSEFAENSEERWVALVARVEALEKKLNGRRTEN